MEQPTNVSSVKSNSENKSNAISAACLVKHSTQNSTVFSHRFDSVNNKQSAGDSAQNGCTANNKFTAAIATETSSHLMKNSIIFFDDFNNDTAVQSPISELSLNISWTKLGSTCDIMGKCTVTGAPKSNKKKEKSSYTSQIRLSTVSLSAM